MRKILSIFLITVSIIFSYNYTMAQKSKLKVGDNIPLFELKNQDGIAINIRDFIGKKNIIIYFYPKDDTSGCTKEACKFRDEYEDFTDLDAIVIGISGDSVASHKNFTEKYKLPFTLLSDANNVVRKLFGVPKSMFIIPGRVTYVVNKQGEIIYVFNSMKNAEQHVIEAKKILSQQ